MGHTYTSLLVHYTFSTKGRAKLLPSAVRERLWPYMGGIARKNGIKALAIGGTDDHVHMLASLPPTMTVVKGGSSGWISKTFPALREFEWQEGYGAFSVSISHLKKAVTYIENQETHHRKITFQDEFIALLKKHGIAYDERFIWR